MMKDILNALSAIDRIEKEQLTESTVAEVSNFDSKKVSTGTVYSRKYDPETGETTGTKRTDNDAKRGRGRPKANAGNDGEVMKPDWSAFGVKPVKLSKDPNARKIKGRDTIDTVDESAVMKRALEVIEGAVMLEKEMTDAQMAKREEIVKGMKKNMAGFKKRYGNRAEAVMYATATKQAMAEGADSYMPSGEEIMGKRPEDETMGDKVKKFAKKLANKIAPDDETLLRDLEKKTIGEDKVEEDDVEEGNAFTGAKAKAEAEGKDEFEVDGKKYKVNEAKDKDDDKKDDKEPPFEGGKKSSAEHKDEFGNVIKDKNMAKHLAKKGMKEFMETVDLAECGEPMMPAGEITITGTPDALAGMLKLAGMQSMAIQTPAMPPMEEVAAEEEAVDEWANSPEGVEGDEEYQGVDAAIPSGDDLHKEKGAYPATAGGDNPMAIDEEMWAAYQALKAELQ